MKTLTNFFLVMGIAFSVMGCTTMADARHAEGSGESKVYDVGYDKAWTATIKTLKKLGLEIAGDNKGSGYIMAQRGVTAFSWGENVAVFVRKKSEAKTEVEVVSKRAMVTNFTAPNWSEDILTGISQNIELE